MKYSDKPTETSKPTESRNNDIGEVLSGLLLLNQTQTESKQIWSALRRDLTSGC